MNNHKIIAENHGRSRLQKYQEGKKKYVPVSKMGSTILVCVPSSFGRIDGCQAELAVEKKKAFVVEMIMCIYFLVGHHHY